MLRRLTLLIAFEMALPGVARAQEPVEPKGTAEPVTAVEPVAAAEPAAAVEPVVDAPLAIDLTASDLPTGERSLVLPLAATGVAVAGVVVGAIFASMGQTSVQYANPELAANEARTNANGLAVAANVAFGVAGLAALTGGVLLVLDYRDPGDDPTVAGSQASATLVVPF